MNIKINVFKIKTNMANRKESYADAADEAARSEGVTWVKLSDIKCELKSADQMQKLLEEIRKNRVKRDDDEIPHTDPVASITEVEDDDPLEGVTPLAFSELPPPNFLSAEKGKKLLEEIRNRRFKRNDEPLTCENSDTDTDTDDAYEAACGKGVTWLKLDELPKCEFKSGKQMQKILDKRVPDDGEEVSLNDFAPATLLSPTEGKKLLEEVKEINRTRREQQASATK